MSHVRLDILQIKELIKIKFRQMIENPGLKVRPLFIEGHSGIGKTQIVRQAAAELAEELSAILNGAPVQCRTMNLQFTERPEFMGLGYITSDNKTAFAYPLLLPEDGYGLYFMDEANRVDRDIRSGMLTLLEDRAINGHQMGKFWLPVLAGNPDEGGYEVNQFDVALADRVAKVWFEGKIEHTISFFKRKYPGHPLVDFLAHHQDFVSFNGDGISPRTFEYAITATLNFDKLPVSTIEMLLSAELGYDATAVILAFINDQRAPDYEDILSGNPESLRWIVDNAERNDAITMINRSFIADLKHKTAKGEKFSDAQRAVIQRYLLSIRDEYKHALVVDTTREKVTLEFMKYFVQGTPMAETFIKMFAGNKS